MSQVSPDFYSQAYFLGTSGERGNFSLLDIDAKFRDRTQTVVEYFDLAHHNPGLIIEAGCGTAPFYRVIREQQALDDIDIVCTDLTDNGVNLLAAKDRPPFKEASADALPFADESVGGIILWDVLEHVQHPESVLIEARRVLKDGGFVHIVCPNPDSWLRDMADPDKDPYRRDKSHIFPPIVTTDFLQAKLSEYGFDFEVYTRGFEGKTGKSQMGLSAMRLAGVDRSGSHVVAFARKIAGEHHEAATRAKVVLGV